MKGVVELDRVAREERAATDTQTRSHDNRIPQSNTTNTESRSSSKPNSRDAVPEPTHPLVDSDGDELEEIEVTDEGEDFDDEHPNKRLKSEEPEDGPVDFDEDDIAFQLAAMGEEYELDPGEYGESNEDLEEGAEGLPLTLEDSTALFKDMLNDYNVSPYTTWDALLEDGRIIEDDRYTSLSTMRSRRDVWGDWSRDRMQALKEERAKEEQKDPRIAYFAFLEAKATPKLYWPEFRRKFQKEPEMKSSKIPDKDREKWYREFITRLKTSESSLKADLVSALTAVPLLALNRSTDPDHLPVVLLTDLRYRSLRSSVRNPMIKAHIASLPDRPTDLTLSPEEEATLVKEKEERQRRERALAERQKHVEEEKRRQRGALHQSKGKLREEEEEVERAMRVGKEGLKHYMQGVE